MFKKATIKLYEKLFIRKGILPFSIFYKMSQIIVISLFYNYSKVLSPLCLYLKSIKLGPELLLKISEELAGLQIKNMNHESQAQFL